MGHLEEIVWIVFNDYDVWEETIVRPRSRDNRGADRTQHKYHRLLASVVRSLSVAMFVSVGAAQALRTTYTTGRILTNGDGIENVGPKI